MDNKKLLKLSLNHDDSLPELVLCPLPSWQVITLNGEDKKSYLHGQVTADVVSLKPDSSTLGAHCDAKGKMWSIFRLFHHQQGYALFQHASAIEKALTEIKKYAIFSKVDITISDEQCFGVIGTKADEFITKLSNETGDVRQLAQGTAVRISAQRWLIVANAHYLTQISTDHDLYQEDIWDLHDILQAIPRITAAHQAEHIPQALNLQALGGISFTKGCYTGQETVARAKYRGINKRALLPLMGDYQGELGGNIQLERQVGDNWRNAGSFLIHYNYADNIIIGLSVQPNDLETTSVFRIKQLEVSNLTLEPLPYSLESE